MKMKFNLLLGLGLLAGGSAAAQNAPKDSAAVKQPFATVTCKDSVATNITYHMPTETYENKIVLKEMKSYPAGPWGMNHGMGYYYSQKNDKGEIEYKEVKLSMTAPSVRKDVLPIVQMADVVCRTHPNATVTDATEIFPIKTDFNVKSQGEMTASIALPTPSPLKAPTVTDLLETDFQKLKEALIGKPKALGAKPGDKPGY